MFIRKRTIVSLIEKSKITINMSELNIGDYKIKWKMTPLFLLLTDITSKNSFDEGETNHALN
jgi:hypothetical protein